MPFKEEAFGFFIDIAFDEDGVFIFLCNFWQFKCFRSSYFLVLFWTGISEGSFHWFLKEIDLEKVILGDLNFFFYLLNHFHIRLAILLKRNEFMSIDRRWIWIPVVLIKDRGGIVGIKYTKNFVVRNLFHFR